MLSAGLILFPSPRFAGILEAAGKKTFPSAFSYYIRKSRLAQEVLFQFLKCPHPCARVYYGRQKKAIADDFAPPFIAMGPRVSGGAQLISAGYEQSTLVGLYNPLIIQEIVEYEERFLLVFVNYQCAGILKRSPSDNRHAFDRLGRSTALAFHRVEFPNRFSAEIVPWIEELLRSVNLNDIAVEIGLTGQGWQLIEFVRPPRRWPSNEGVVDRFGLICRMLESGKLTYKP